MWVKFIKIISICLIVYTLCQIFVTVQGSESNFFMNYFSPCEKCDNGTKCFIRQQVCDRYFDCEVGDEVNCDNCTSSQWTCYNDQCIDLDLRCNVYVDCRDKSDEDNCTSCAVGKRLCNNTGQCIYDDDVCDGVNNCLDMSDELNCSGQCRGWSCSNGQCIYKSSRCNGFKNCIDGSDEENCIECAESAFVCNTSKPKCISKDNRCDGIRDCDDNSDELNCAKCEIGSILCNNSQCIDDVLQCNGRNDCNDGNDEADCERCSCDAFSCGDKHCLDISKQCDGIPHCEDKRDEKKCTSCKDGAWKCGDGSCILGRHRCDGDFHCDDQSDEYKCSNCSNNAFRCSDGTCIPQKYRCDGHPHCDGDKLDEKNCDKCTPSAERCKNISCLNPPKKSDDFNYCIFTETLPENCLLCSNDTWRCGDGVCIQASERCDNTKQCSDGSDEENCGCIDNPNSFYKNMTCSQMGPDAWFHCLNPLVNRTCCKTCQDALIGLHVHPREQCKYQRGCNASFSRVQEPDIDLNINPSSICTNMPCRVGPPDSTDVKLQPSLTGTPCGYKKVCKNLLCVPDEKGKNVPETCVFDDDPAFMYDNNKCNDMTVYQQQHCYRKDVKQNCCYKCREFDHNLQRYDVAELPGQRQTLEQQCEDLIQGQLCRNILPQISQICTSLPCKGLGNSSCEFYIAAAGTDCGEDRMCISEQCVSKRHYMKTEEAVVMKYIFYASLAILIVFLIAAAYVLVRHHRKYNLCLTLRGKHSGSYSDYQDIDHYDFLDDNEVDNVEPVISNKVSEEDNIQPEEVDSENVYRKSGENQNTNETDELGELYNDAESTAVIAALRNPINPDVLPLGEKKHKVDHPYDHLMNAKVGIYPGDRMSNDYAPFVLHSSFPVAEKKEKQMNPQEAGDTGLENIPPDTTELDTDNCYNLTIPSVTSDPRQNYDPTQNNYSFQNYDPTQNNYSSQNNDLNQDNDPTQDNDVICPGHYKLPVSMFGQENF